MCPATNAFMVRESATQDDISGTYPTPAHAETFVKRHRTLIDEYRLDTVHHAVQLSVLIRHQAYFHDVCSARTHESFRRYSDNEEVLDVPTGFEVIEQKSLYRNS